MLLLPRVRAGRRFDVLAAAIAILSGCGASGGAPATGSGGAGAGGSGDGAGGGVSDAGLPLDVGSGGSPGGTGGAAPAADAAMDRADETEPDGPGGPTRMYVYVSGYAPPISIFTLNLAAGTLTPAGMATTSPDGEPTSLTVAPNKRVLYAGDEQENGPMSRVIAYAINPDDGTLREINRQGTGGRVNAHQGIHPSGKWLLTANYGTGDVTVFPVRADGGLDPGQPPVPAGGQAHYVLFDQSGKFVLVPCIVSRHIAVFRFDNGVLTPNDPPTVAVNGGPRHLVLSQDERFLYALTQGESTVVSFTFDKTTGRLLPLETLPSAPSASTSAHIALHPSGKFLYASNRRDNSVAIFAVDTGTGRLTARGYQRDMISTPWWFGLDPTGTMMLVANDRSASVSLHRIDLGTGALQRVGSAVSVAMRPTFVGVLTLP